MGGMPESQQFPLQQISRRHKVWLGLNFLLRMVATGVLILVIYFFIPVEGAAGLVTTAALALIAMVIYTWAVIRMIGRISAPPTRCWSWARPWWWRSCSSSHCSPSSTW